MVDFITFWSRNGYFKANIWYQCWYRSFLEKYQYQYRYRILDMDSIGISIGIESLDLESISISIGIEFLTLDSISIVSVSKKLVSKASASSSISGWFWTFTVQTHHMLRGGRARFGPLVAYRCIYRLFTKVCLWRFHIGLAHVLNSLL